MKPEYAAAVSWNCAASLVVAAVAFILGRIQKRSRSRAALPARLGRSSSERIAAAAIFGYGWIAIFCYAISKLAFGLLGDSGQMIVSEILAVLGSALFLISAAKFSIIDDKRRMLTVWVSGALAISVVSCVVYVARAEAIGTFAMAVRWLEAGFHFLAIGSIVPGLWFITQALFRRAVHLREAWAKRAAAFSSLAPAGMLIYALLQWVAPLAADSDSVQVLAFFVGGACKMSIAVGLLMAVQIEVGSLAHSASRSRASAEEAVRKREIAIKLAASESREQQARLEALEQSVLAEDAINQREGALKANEEALWQLKHEMKTPLLDLTMNCNLLGEIEETGVKAADKVEISKAIKKILAALERFRGVVSDAFVSLQWRDSLNIESDDAPVNVDLNRIILAMSMEARARHKARMRFSFENSRGIRVKVVPRELAQVLTILLDNAYEATNSNAKSPRIKIRTQVSDDGAVAFVDVEDDGTGIDDSVIDRLFERGASSKGGPPEHGIGLFAARAFARGWGGDLCLGSPSGKMRTCFRLSIPRASGVA